MDSLLHQLTANSTELAKSTSHNGRSAVRYTLYFEFYCTFYQERIFISLALLCRSNIEGMRSAVHKLNTSVSKLERQYQSYNTQAREQLHSLEGIRQQLPEYEQLVSEAAQLQDTYSDKRNVCTRLQVMDTERNAVFIQLIVLNS